MRAPRVLIFCTVRRISISVSGQNFSGGFSSKNIKTHLGLLKNIKRNVFWSKTCFFRALKNFMKFYLEKQQFQGGKLLGRPF